MAHPAHVWKVVFGHNQEVAHVLAPDFESAAQSARELIEKNFRDAEEEGEEHEDYLLEPASEVSRVLLLDDGEY